MIDGIGYLPHWLLIQGLFTLSECYEFQSTRGSCPYLYFILTAKEQRREFFTKKATKESDSPAFRLRGKKILVPGSPGWYARILSAFAVACMESRILYAPEWEAKCAGVAVIC
jgi:hypothetical protein